MGTFDQKRDNVLTFLSKSNCLPSMQTRRAVPSDDWETAVMTTVPVGALGERIVQLISENDRRVKGSENTIIEAGLLHHCRETSRQTREKGRLGWSQESGSGVTLQEPG